MASETKTKELGIKTRTWQNAIFSEVVGINPRRGLGRGKKYPFVAMDALPTVRRQIQMMSERSFDGGGSKFTIGDTLFARITPCLENGKTAFVQELNGQLFGHGSTEFIVFSGKEGTTDNLFVYYLARSPLVREFAIQNMTGTSGRQRVPTDVFDQLEITLSSLPEQRAIAHILGTLDDKIELNRRMNETLEQMARAIFKSWFVDFDPVRAKAEGRKPAGMDAETATLFPDSLEGSPVGKIPRGWQVVSLTEAIDVNPPRDLSKGAVAPYLDMQNMPTAGHRPLDWIDRPFGSGMRFINGDTLVARITPCLENGKTAFVDFLDDGRVGWGSTEYIVLKPKPPLSVEYGYYLARSEGFRSFMITNMTGTSGRQRVPAPCLEHFNIVIPPEKIAEKFGKFAKQAMCQIKANDEQSRTLAAIRDDLLPKLLSGKIRVKDAEKVVL